VTDRKHRERQSYQDTFRLARERRGWTQRQLGQEIGVSRQSICYYESGKGYPSEPVLDRLCSALGLDYHQHVERCTVWHDHSAHWSATRSSNATG
jgi:transcriptional regulator with XRE-family HTH domain